MVPGVSVCVIAMAMVVIRRGVCHVREAATCPSVTPLHSTIRTPLSSVTDASAQIDTIHVNTHTVNNTSTHTHTNTRIHTADTPTSRKQCETGRQERGKQRERMTRECDVLSSFIVQTSTK